MKTEIFATYKEFLNRADKSINGVSPEFADANPGWDKEACNRGCWDCVRCVDCVGCEDCEDCVRCVDCVGCVRCVGKKEDSLIAPKIHNIHRAVLEAASADGALDMSAWHICETTHCRAGWVVTLAGADGKALEEKKSTLFAAMQIYKASSPIRVSPTRFFENADAAMADMRRCAELEATGTPPQ